MDIPVDPDRRRLRRGALAGLAWSALQKTGGHAASLVTFVILARLLAPEDFGLVAMATALVTLVTLLFDLSVTQYLVQQVNLRDRTTDTAFWCALGLGVAVAMVVSAGAPLAAIAFGEPRLTLVVVALALTVPLSSLSAVPQALLRRSLTFSVLSRRSLLAIAVSGVVGVGLALGGAGVWALVAQAYVLPLVSIVLFYGVAGWRPRFRWDGSEAKIMLRYGTQLWGLSSLNQVRSGGDSLVIGAMLGPASLGIYTVAKRLVRQVNDIFGGVVLQVVTPVLAAAKDDPDRVRRGYMGAVGASAAVVLPATMGLAAISGILVPLLFGETWRDAGAVAQIIAFGAGVAMLIHFDRSLFLALDKPQVELKSSAFTTLLGVAVVAAGATLGLVAVAVAVTAWAYLTWGWRVAVLHRRGGISAGQVIMTILPIWFAAVTSGVVAWGILVLTSDWPPLWAVLVAVVGGAVIYPPVLRLVARPTVRRMRLLVPKKLERHVLVRLVLRYLLGPSGHKTPVVT